MTPKLAEKLTDLGVSATQSGPRLRAQLKAILKTEHPDSTGGSYLSTGQEARYLAANEAMELLDAIPKSGTGKALQLLAETHGALAQAQSSLFKVIEEERREATASDQQRAVDAAQSKANLAIDRNVRQRYGPISFGGWGLAAVAGAVALLDKPLGGILDGILDPPKTYMAKVVLGFISLVGLMLGFAAKNRETTVAASLKKLATDAGIEYLFYSYEYIIFRGPQDDDEVTFSISSLADALAEHMRIRDRSACEYTAEAIVKKLEQRKLITLTNGDGLSPSYKIRRAQIEDRYSRAYSEFVRRPSPIARVKRAWPVRRFFDWHHRIRLERRRKGSEEDQPFD